MHTIHSKLLPSMNSPENCTWSIYHNLSHSMHTQLHLRAICDGCTSRQIANHIRSSWNLIFMQKGQFPVQPFAKSGKYLSTRTLCSDADISIRRLLSSSKDPPPFEENFIARDKFIRCNCRPLQQQKPSLSWQTMADEQWTRRCPGKQDSKMSTLKRTVSRQSDSLFVYRAIRHRCSINQSKHSTEDIGPVLLLSTNVLFGPQWPDILNMRVLCYFHRNRIHDEAKQRWCDQSICRAEGIYLCGSRSYIVHNFLARACRK